MGWLFTLLIIQIDGVAIVSKNNGIIINGSSMDHNIGIDNSGLQWRSHMTGNAGK